VSVRNCRIEIEGRDAGWRILDKAKFVIQVADEGYEG
jgi:hypothetical protein